MKNTLRFFGLLDVVSIIIISPSVYLLLTHLSQWKIAPATLTLSILRIVVFISLFISAAGSILAKKFGIITYYIQFLFRFITFTLSFGFITYANEYITANIERYTLAGAIFGETIRIYLTYNIHQRLFK